MSLWNKHPKLESQIEDHLFDLCKRNNCLCLKLRLDDQRGFPDRTIISPTGRVAFVELKRPDGKLSAHQHAWNVRLNNQNVEASILYCLEAVDVWFDTFMKGEQ